MRTVTKGEGGVLGMGMCPRSMQITSVKPGGPADTVGVKIGMRVAVVNGCVIATKEDYYYFLSQAPDTFTLKMVMSKAEDARGEMVGTLQYAAPEVYAIPEQLSDLEYDAMMADVWSVGAVLFVMLTGKVPFGAPGASETEVAADASKAVIQPYPDGVSASAKDFVKKLIVVKPHFRLRLEKSPGHGWWTDKSASVPKRPQTASRMPPINVKQMERQFTSGGLGVLQAATVVKSPRNSPRAAEQTLERLESSMNKFRKGKPSISENPPQCGERCESTNQSGIDDSRFAPTPHEEKAAGGAMRHRGLMLLLSMAQQRRLGVEALTAAA